MDKINLGYCIIKNPFSKEGEIMIFVSTKTSPSLNYEIFYRPAYKKTVKLLKRLGFIQADTLTFENIKGDDVDINYVQTQLEYSGLSYNKNLEASIRKEMKSIQEKRRPVISDSIVDISLYIQNKTPLLLPGYTERIPEIGEVIELYFYLFLQTAYDKNGRIRYFLNGDFSNKKKDTSKKLVKITNSKFIRVNNPDTSYDINFESISTYREILEGIDSLYAANLELKDSAGKKHFSPIMEAKSYINPLDFITVNVKNKSEYGTLIEWSDSIKTESKLIQRNNISKDFAIAKLIKIQNHLQERVKTLIEEEHYELAKAHNDSIELLDKKKQWLFSLKKERIDYQDYDLNMSIGEIPEHPILSPFLDYNL